MATTHAPASSASDAEPFRAGSSARFAATRWTLVLAAGHWRADPAAHQAMSALARLYWFPLYAYLRRRGCAPHEAEDTVQGFFAQLLDKDGLTKLDRSKGKFRSFLLASLEHFLANERDKARAQKRDATRCLPLDALDAEARYAVEPADDMTPQRVYERRWAWAVLDQVLHELRRQYQAAGKADLFDALKGTLAAGAQTGFQAQAAHQLGLSPGAVTVAAHRLRRRYRELLRTQIAHTVGDPALVDEEIQFLLSRL